MVAGWCLDGDARQLHAASSTPPAPRRQLHASSSTPPANQPAAAALLQLLHIHTHHHTLPTTLHQANKQPAKPPSPIAAAVLCPVPSLPPPHPPAIPSACITPPWAATQPLHIHHSPGPPAPAHHQLRRQHTHPGQGAAPLTAPGAPATGRRDLARSLYLTPTPAAPTKQAQGA
jgi:hypothetical protein